MPQSTGIVAMSQRERALCVHGTHWPSRASYRPPRQPAQYGPVRPGAHSPSAAVLRFELAPTHALGPSRQRRTSAVSARARHQPGRTTIVSTVVPTGQSAELLHA